MHSPPLRSLLRKSFVAILFLCSASANAQLIFTVNSTLDEVDINLTDGICQTAAGKCTLRAAVMQANQVVGAGATIVLPVGTFVLTRDSGVGNDDSYGDLDLNTPISGNPTITIRGAGATASIIDANQIDRVLEVKASRTALISDLTIRGGFASNSSGGGFSNIGHVTLARVLILNNEGDFGGGIHNVDPGSMSVFDCTISANLASVGAGISNLGDLIVDHSTIAGNTALENGGGLISYGPSTIRNSLIAGNSAHFSGGGITYAFSLNHYLINTTISGNMANSNGGGIYLFDGSAFVYNTSVIGNDADHDRDENGGTGGGAFVRAGARFAVLNSLFSDNTVLDSPIFNDCAGILEGYGTNMVGTTNQCSSNNAPLSLVSANTIGPLQNNGGPTFTHALLAGSQAIDASSPSLTCLDEVSQPLPFDQRGAPRVFGVRCDVGAFEFGSAVDILLFANGFE